MSEPADVEEVTVALAEEVVMTVPAEDVAVAVEEVTTVPAEDVAVAAEEVTVPAEDVAVAAEDCVGSTTAAEDVPGSTLAEEMPFRFNEELVSPQAKNTAAAATESVAGRRIFFFIKGDLGGDFTPQKYILAVKNQKKTEKEQSFLQNITE